MEPEFLSVLRECFVCVLFVFLCVFVCTTLHEILVSGCCCVCSRVVLYMFRVWFRVFCARVCACARACACACVCVRVRERKHLCQLVGKLETLCVSV